MPQYRKYDHHIELKPNVPASIRCRVYPMSLKEDKELDKFINENLRLKRIDRKLQPV
jgi:hypothetical protein